MHYRESFFRDPFFADCWNILDKSATMTERHSSTKSERHSESSTRSSSSQEEHHRESEERQSPKPPSETPSHGMSKVVNDPDKFQVFVEVENFAPEELVVKTVDHYVVVEGKHEEKKEPHGFISRQFTRKYLLPIDCKPENVSCNLSADGILLISVPKENIDLLPLKETIIEISKTDKKLKDDAKNPTAAA
jgi:HSP20 family molecular chaperone IbpA